MTDLVEKLTDDLITVDGQDPAAIRARDAETLRRYNQLAIQAMTTIRFHLEQDGEL